MTRYEYWQSVASSQTTVGNGTLITNKYNPYEVAYISDNGEATNGDVIGYSGKYFYVLLEISLNSQYYNKLTSTISCRCYCGLRDISSGPSSIQVRTPMIQVGGTFIRKNSKTYTVSQGEELEIYDSSKGATSVTIQHASIYGQAFNIDVSALFYYSSSSYWSYDSGETAINGFLPTHSKYPFISDFTESFNNAQVPEVTIIAPYGSGSATLALRFTNGTSTYVVTREDAFTWSDGGTSHTYYFDEFTDKEFISIYALMSTTNTIQVWPYLIYNSEALDTALTIYADFYLDDGSAPIVTPNVYVTDELSLSLTGSSTKCIYGLSSMNIGASYTLNYGSTLKEFYYTLGDSTTKYKLNNKVLSKVTADKVTFVVTNSRSETTKVEYTIDQIPYVYPTANIDITNISGVGDATFNITGNIFTGNFATSKPNKYTIYYRMKKYGEDYSDWVTVSSSSISITDNTYKATITLSDLEYKARYTFQAKITDLCMTIEGAENSINSTPVFDWGYDSFNFNVPVYVQGSLVASNQTAIYNGSALLKASNYSITLTNPVSSSLHGIVLMFSGSATAGPYVCFFVPKLAIELCEGSVFRFYISYGSSSSYQANYGLTINDSKIYGVSGNSSSVYLRYVISI